MPRRMAYDRWLFFTVGLLAVGGLLIVAIAIDLIGIKRLPVGNLLPAVFVAIGLLWMFGMA